MLAPLARFPQAEIAARIVLTTRVVTRSARCATSPFTALRDRALLAGAASLSDLELLALLLTPASRGDSSWSPAASLLQQCGDLSAIARLGAHELAIERQLGPTRAAHLVAALEVGRRVAIRQLSDEREVIGSFDSVAAWARPRLAHLEHEEVWVLMLDGRNGLRSTARVAQGGLHGCALTPRDVLRPPLRENAHAMVLVHNHPSGDPTPSCEDVAMTRAVASAGDLVGVPLLDHVVVARAGATSLLELGALGH